MLLDLANPKIEVGDFITEEIESVELEELLRRPLNKILYHD